MLYGSLAIISITILIDFVEDINYNKFKFNKKLLILFIIFYLLFIYSIHSLSLLIIFLVIINYYKPNIITNYNFLTIIKKVNSFSLDSLFNFSLYSANTKGLNLFVSIDNFLVETANHINFYKKISFYLQRYSFNKFLLQININLFLALIFIVSVLFLI